MHLFKALLAYLVAVVAHGSPTGISTGYLPTDLLRITQELSKTQLGRCSNMSATLPLDKTKPTLPPPSSGLSLKYVALGRGTQNYTCPSPQESITPEAVGALATVFDASCLVDSHPSLFYELPGALSNVPVETLAYLATGLLVSPETGGLLLGKHYFDVAGVPFFDLRFGGSNDWTTAKVVARAPAPSKGSGFADNSDGQNIPWLKLASTGGEGIQVSIHTRLYANRYAHATSDLLGRKSTVSSRLVVPLRLRAKGRRTVWKSSMRRNTGSLVDCCFAFSYLANFLY